MNVVKTLHGGQLKVEVFQREDGSFGFEELKWLPEENCWVPVRRQITSVIDTLEHAEAEAMERISWLRAARE